MEIGLLLPGMVVIGTHIAMDDVPEELMASLMKRSAIPDAHPSEFVVLQNAKVVLGDKTVQVEHLLVLNSQVLGRLIGTPRI